jgi:PKD repeat protein
VNFDGAVGDECDAAVEWDFGDGTTSTEINTTHVYAAPGVYTATLAVADPSGNVSTEQFIVVVYDPSGGFVTGGGWIDSPAGAYKSDPSLTGKANFGFVSKYKKGATTPTGNTQFVFHAGVLNFHSSSYQWLVVNQDGSNAQFKGAGTVNGEGDYKFMLWAGDGESDTFRIRIWEEDEQGNETDVYDNGVDQEISGGAIMIQS